MQFQVPQFIEVEDRIFGPLTLRQSLYVGGGIGAGIMLYVYIPYKFIAILIAIPVVAFSLALAFYLVNGKPLTNTIENAIYYFSKDKLYLWKKVEKKPTKKLEDQINLVKTTFSVPKISESKLKDLTWSLDIKESILSGQNNKNN
ncbi:MAG: PrgI family protein [Candidatus Paceibacterota bacterium]|jgi:phosphate/sulfate permease